MALALGRVVMMRSCSMIELAMLRDIAFLWEAVRPSLKPATR